MPPKITNAIPRAPKLSDCEFYHTFDLPDGTHIDGHWDIRGLFETYTGHVSLTGKSFLDVGTASGFLSFSAERAGASHVLSVDAAADCRLIPIPWRENEGRNLASSCHATLERIKNGYWYCHRAFGSRAQCVYADAHDLDASLGTFDVVIAGCILLHLCDPIGALMAIAARSASTLVVTELDPVGFTGQPVLLPNFARSRIRTPNDFMSWWQFPPESLSLFLDVMGFDTLRVERFTMQSPLMHQTGHFYSLVAQRRP